MTSAEAPTKTPTNAAASIALAKIGLTRARTIARHPPTIAMTTDAVRWSHRGDDEIDRK
jgi:hypothetical protein